MAKVSHANDRESNAKRFSSRVFYTVKTYSLKSKKEYLSET